MVILIAFGVFFAWSVCVLVWWAAAPPPKRHADTQWVRFKTWLLDRVSTMTDRRVRLSAVRNMKFAHHPGQMAPGHSHPVAAANRTSATRFLSKVAEQLGKRRYDVSVAARERGGLATGPRQLRVAKDLLSDSAQAALELGDFVTMVDNDYYLSLDELSNYAGHDMGFYCLQPNGLDGSGPDSRWSFTSPDEVTEEVSGGAVYHHKVWDWGKDFVVLSRGPCTYVYDVVHFPVAPARSVIVLLLARTMVFPRMVLGLLVPDLYENHPTRMEVEQHGEYIVGTFGTPSNRMVCVKPAMRFGVSQVTVAEDVFHALSVAAKIPNTDKKVPRTELLPSGVERICRAEGVKMSVTGAHMLSDYFTHSYQPLALVNYQSCGPLKLEDGSATVALAAVPVAGPGCGPTASANNEARAIDARVVSVANREKFSPEMVAYGREFAEMVVTRVHKGVPWSIEELRMVQSKPTQRARRRIEEQFTADNRPNLTTTSFQKRESYAKVGDPRLINQVPTDHTNRLCAYAGAFKDALCGRSNKHWFMVGKTPSAVAQSLRNLRSATPGRVVGGDYSRMDGRTSVAYRRHVLLEAMLRFFHPAHHEELQRLLGKEEKARTVTRGHGVRAEMGGANLSGSGVTTILNTLDSAFNEFAARRRRGQVAEEAFKRLGCYFGDDSAVCQSVFEDTKKVATECGMKLELEPVPPEAGDGYVVFLSRVYPDIRTSLASHPCITRALKKACMVQVAPGADTKVISTKMKLKADGVLVTDSHVPVLGNYARALKRVYRLEERAASGNEWESYAKTDAAYSRRVTAGAYPYNEADRDALVASVAWDLGLTPEEVVRLDAALGAATTEEELLACSLDGHELKLPEWAAWVPTDLVAL